MLDLKSNKIKPSLYYMKTQFKFILLIFFIIISINNSMAQVGYEDVVYLKNGTIVHGIIVEQVPNESVKIQTRNKDVFFYKMEEIEKITKEKKYGRDTERAEKPPESSDLKKDPYTGYIITIESHLGQGISSNDDKRTTVGTHVINGIMINNMYSIGAGIGFNLLTENQINNYNSNNNYYYYDDYNHQYLVMAYYLDLRAHPIKGKISPLLILDYGYSADLFSGYVSGGVMFNAGLGAKINFTKKLGLNLTLNYKLQKLNYENNNSYYINGTYQTYNPGAFTMEHICLTFGITL